MSRVGKYPIEIKDGVTATIEKETFIAKGKLGELSVPFGDQVQVKIEDKQVVVTPRDENEKFSRSMWGTVRSRIQNVITGVCDGFTKEMQVKGVGYKVALKGKILNLSLGYSHDIDYALPEGVTVTVISPTEFQLVAADKQLVGQVASEIKKLRPPEPYKGKGVMFKGEYIRRKEGKKK